MHICLISAMMELSRDMFKKVEARQESWIDLAYTFLNGERRDYMLHPNSLFQKYKGKNYNGHTPTMGSVDILRKYIMEDFSKELDCVPDLKLIIPLGAAVEEILKEFFEPKSAQYSKVLWGFPHPSGLNGRRKIQFEEKRESMLDILKNGIYPRQSNIRTF